MGFKLVVITPKGLYLEKEIESLTIKLTSGYRTFLTGHAPLIGALDYAPMHLIENGKTIYYAIHGGAINVTKEKTTLVVNSIESQDEIDIERAFSSKERAEKRLAEKDPQIDLKRAKASLMRAIARIKTVNRE